MKTNFCPITCIPSIILKAEKKIYNYLNIKIYVICVFILPEFTLNKARIGLTNIIPTIIIGKMEMELPTMYIINKFIGTYFAKILFIRYSVYAILIIYI